MFVVVKPYQEYRRSISLLALQKGRENKKSRERGREREKETRSHAGCRIGRPEFFLISLKNSLSFAATVRY